jgi:transcriptional regulator GlxA family with amidase domain
MDMISAPPIARPEPVGSRRVLILVLPQVQLQDLAGPAQVFHEAGRLSRIYQLVYCGHSPSVRSAQGLSVGEVEPLPAPREGDLVLVPGISSAALSRPDHALCAWLQDARDAGARIASVGSGAFALARAGLLDGRRCTTHWQLVDRLRAECPRAQVLADRLFVEADGILTSAGIASGIDMALALVEQDHGPLVASRVARVMVVYLRRSGDQEQKTVYLDHRTHLHPGVHRVQDFIVEHPEKRPGAVELARLAAMSPRNLSRVFRRATGITPMQFAAKVRVQVARDLLDDPQLTVDGIAANCGFASSRQLRRLWKKAFGMSISAFRRARAQGGHA